MISDTDQFSEITSNDDELISSLDWITFYPHQAEEAFLQINDVVRNFIIQGKCQSARLAFNKVHYLIQIKYILW